MVFKKSSDVELSEFKKIIQSKLIDAEFFIPEKWSIPRLATFPFDPELDHQWYEFDSIELTDEPATDNRSIEKFLVKSLLPFAMESTPHSSVRTEPEKARLPSCFFATTTQPMVVSS